ncbi:MAG TPA: hypothetical protein VGC62_16385 [Pseudomonas sp.]|uniref:hypothetical protein n=1 Tax=Pseudomonas sp. TaxID=306 RepID=UPI002EDADFAF
MSKQKTELSTVAVESQLASPAPGAEVEVANAGVVLKPIIPAQVFRDKVYTSRTLVMPDGCTLPVAKGRVTAVTEDQFAFLNAHPDLEPLQE